MAQIEHMLTEEEIQGLFRGDRGVAELLERVLNQVLEAEIAEHLGADPHERTDGRRGWRNGEPPRSGSERSSQPGGSPEAPYSARALSILTLPAGPHLPPFQGVGSTPFHTHALSPPTGPEGVDGPPMVCPAAETGP